jgi:hypothetical protein
MHGRIDRQPCGGIDDTLIDAVRDEGVSEQQRGKYPAARAKFHGLT